ncbi:hypothetical protein F7734_04680 [Scytonema sp. UIC 10036]|uniref:hypothetical protein n=1 Tax=Scytonema sp. UIC 10036 TaxID=2304196 RepID=UPI0012DA1499|nr:hypothetical protein [Scytonema sp. UIC 10036]MUG91803.1 hypothetical protein [Scytonema sp. UIC 10036]
MNTTIRRIGIAVTAGSTTLFPLGFLLIQSPAYAALLEFNFTTQQGGTGSFVLDTSVSDTSPDILRGTFPSAISNFTFSGTRPAASSGGLIVTTTGFPDPGIQFRISSAAYGGPFEPSGGGGPVSQLLLNFSSPDDPNFLPSSPNQYVIESSQIGAILFNTGGSLREDISSVTIRSKSIPDPTPTLALLSLMALNAIFSSSQKKVVKNRQKSQTKI